MQRTAILILAASMALATTGCLVTRGSDLPELPQTPTGVAAPRTLSYQFHWQTSGNPNPTVSAKMGQPVVGPELSSSPAFKQVFEGRGGENQLDITVNDHGNIPVAVLTGMLSGLTLTVLPGYARDDFEMTAVLSRGGTELKRYQYTEHATMVMELFLVFGMPFAEGRDAPKNAVRDMTQHLVHDMVADGSLSG